MDIFKQYFITLLLSLTSLRAASFSKTGCPSSLQYPTNLKTFRGYCFQFIPIEKDWYEARDYCEKYGGHLATIPNQETNDFIRDEINSLWWRNNGIWIGLNDLDDDSHYMWTRKASAPGIELGSYTNWGRGHPGAFLSSYRDCVRMVRNGGSWTWHETPCKFPGFHYRFICQYEVQSDYSSTIVRALTTVQTAKPSLETNQLILVIDHGKGHHLEPPVASLHQGAEPGFDDLQKAGESRAGQVVLMTLACLIIIGLVAALFMYRRRRHQREDLLGKGQMKNTSLENASGLASKVENIYIDEHVQKLLKSKETEKPESIYEEIPFDLEKAEAVRI